MPGHKSFIFDAESLVDLITHYTEGAVDLGAKLLSAGVHPMLTRQIGLYMEDESWADNPDVLPTGELRSLNIRYEGKKILAFGGHGDPIWKDADNFGDR